MHPPPSNPPRNVGMSPEVAAAVAAVRLKRNTMHAPEFQQWVLEHFADATAAAIGNAGEADPATLADAVVFYAVALNVLANTTPSRMRTAVLAVESQVRAGNRQSAFTFKG